MSIRMEVWGDYACFTQPSFKTERMSYSVMTPSAARGIVESIYWHPGMKWHVDSIQACTPIRYTNIRRNEVDCKVSSRNMFTAMKTGEKPHIATAQHIVQRATLALKDVRYVIEAHFTMTDKAAPTDNEGKFQDIVTRRLQKGQCYRQPCFGVREFTAHFAPCENTVPCPDELVGTQDLGYMLYDLDYSNPEDICPVYFHAVMTDGVINLRNVEVVR